MRLAESVETRQGQSGRLRIQNATMMSHLSHLHGRTFHIGEAGEQGPRNDMVLVPHNVYHAEAGMMTRLAYVG